MLLTFLLIFCLSPLVVSLASSNSTVLLHIFTTHPHCRGRGGGGGEVSTEESGELNKATNHMGFFWQQ